MPKPPPDPAPLVRSVLRKLDHYYDGDVAAFIKDLQEAAAPAPKPKVTKKKATSKEK